MLKVHLFNLHIFAWLDYHLNSRVAASTAGTCIFHDVRVNSIQLTSSFKRKIMVCCYCTTLVPVPLFILRIQSPAFGLPQIKEFSSLFIEKGNEVCLSIRVFACSSSSFSYGTP